MTFETSLDTPKKGIMVSLEYVLQWPSGFPDISAGLGSKA